jgi:hypothetical protein
MASRLCEGNHEGRSLCHLVTPTTPEDDQVVGVGVREHDLEVLGPQLPSASAHVASGRDPSARVSASTRASARRRSSAAASNPSTTGPAHTEPSGAQTQAPSASVTVSHSGHNTPAAGVPASRSLIIHLFAARSWLTSSGEHRTVDSPHKQCSDTAPRPPTGQGAVPRLDFSLVNGTLTHPLARRPPE